MKPIFVRPLKPEEIESLEKNLKSYDIIIYKRAKTILLSAEGKKVSEIAKEIDFHRNSVLFWVNEFNRNGLKRVLSHPQNGGPKPKIDKEARKRIIDLLKDKPQKYGLIQTSWTLDSLTKTAIKKLKIVKEISFVRIWQIIQEEGYSYQKSKDWIKSPDPQYDLKKRLLIR